MPAGPGANLLSLAYLTVDGADPVEHVEAARAGGFDAAGLRIAMPSHLAGGRQVVGDAQAVREIKRACRATGVRVWDVEVITLAPDTAMEAVVPVLETAAEIGAAWVQCVCEDTDLERSLDRFTALCDAADKYPLSIALEFMQFRAVQTIEDAIAMVVASECLNAGVLVDALHLSRSGGVPDTVSGMPRQFIAYMQLCDAPAKVPTLADLPREARTARLYPGEGALPLDALMDVLPRSVAISVEVPTLAAVGLSAAERAIRAGDAARRYLAEYSARRR